MGLDDEMQRRLWERVMRGLSMRSYDPMIRESSPSFGISESAVSDRFAIASSQRVEDICANETCRSCGCVHSCWMESSSVRNCS